MKRITLLFLYCVLLSCISSCSSQDDISSSGSAMPLTASKTIKKLSFYNDSIKSLYKTTRTINRNYVYKADVLGAINGFGLGSSVYGVTIIGGPGLTIASIIAGTLSVGCLYSAYAATHCGGYMIPYDQDDIYLASKNYLYTNSIETDSDFSLLTENDSIIELLDTPHCAQKIKGIGIAHNQIIESLKYSHLRPRKTDPDTGNKNNNPIEANSINYIFENNEFKTSFINQASRIVNCTTDNGIDFNSLLQNNQLSPNVTSIINLFLDGFDYIPHDTTHMVNYINTYLNIIENNNELTSDNIQQLYSGFILALYSSLYWESYDYNFDI